MDQAPGFGSRRVCSISGRRVLSEPQPSGPRNHSPRARPRSAPCTRRTVNSSTSAFSSLACTCAEGKGIESPRELWRVLCNLPRRPSRRTSVPASSRRSSCRLSLIRARRFFSTRGFRACGKRATELRARTASRKPIRPRPLPAPCGPPVLPNDPHPLGLHGPGWAPGAETWSAAPGSRRWELSANHTARRMAAGRPQ